MDMNIGKNILNRHGRIWIFFKLMDMALDNPKLCPCLSTTATNLQCIYVKQIKECKQRVHGYIFLFPLRNPKGKPVNGRPLMDGREDKFLPISRL